MRIIIRFHDDCKSDTRIWLARLPGSVEDRRMLVDTALEAMKQELVRTAGHPPRAEFRAGPPERYWWKFAADCWVEFAVVDSGRLMRTRTIEVMGFQPGPPA